MTNKIHGNSHQVSFDDDNYLRGDGTGGRVMRVCQLLVEDGTNASTIKCTLSSKWNGDAIAATDNIGKSATTGNFTLNARGNGLTIESAGLTGNAVVVLAAYIEAEKTGFNFGTIVESGITSNDIVLTLTDGNEGGAVDLTAIEAGGPTKIHIAYLTDA